MFSTLYHQAAVVYFEARQRTYSLNMASKAKNQTNDSFWKVTMIKLFLLILMTIPSVIISTAAEALVVVKTGETVRLHRQYVVGNFCGGDGPSITAFQTPKFGVLNVQKAKEKIPPNTHLGGDGHSYCNKETGVSTLFYKAGDTPGKDQFSVAVQYGNETRIFHMTVIVKDKIESKSNSSIAKMAQNKSIRASETTRNDNPILINDLPPTNEYFNNLRVGSTYQYEVTNDITKKKSTSTVVITEKNDRDFSASTNSGSLTVMNTLFEQIETPVWKSNNRSCDGILSPLKLGSKTDFSFSSEHIEKDAKQRFNKKCLREISYQGVVTVQGKEHSVFMSKNQASYTINSQANRTDIFNAEFSPEISFWTNISIESRVNNRLIDKRSYKLRAYALGEEYFSLFSQLCSKQCDVKDENIIDLAVVKENYASQEECEIDKEKRSALIMANANSIGRYVAIFCAKKSALNIDTKR